MLDKKATQHHECLFTIIMSSKRKRSVLSIKDKQSILRSEKGEKRTNLSAGGVSTQQASDIHKNKKFAYKLRDQQRTKSLQVAHEEQRTVKM